ncbi:glycosyltransferase family 2 protein, partial [bacterium]|nr:glycosyltransferase family 2 protein [candidate division CSSED10-310 bacterium]
MEKKLSMSVVIPICNEEENLPELYRRLRETLLTMDRVYEVVFIDDGSADRSYEMLKEYQEQDPSVRILHLSRNFGQQAAVTAGFEHARGDVLLAMDGDLQVAPEDIPKLMAKIDEGYEAAVGYRAQRPESFILRRLPSALANKVFSRLLGMPFRDFGCGMQAFR